MTTGTREQLALAAKAVGIEPAINALFKESWKSINGSGCFEWNPSVDHGQLFDLAMACGIDICATEGFVGYYRTKFDYVSVNVDCQDFPSLAEAVINAAAEQKLAKEGKE